MNNRVYAIRDTETDVCYAVKDENGLYYCGFKQWDKQIRKAKFFHSYHYAKEVIDDTRYAAIELKIVRVFIKEMEEYNPDLEVKADG